MPKTARAEAQAPSAEDEITQTAIKRLQEGGEGRLQEIMISLTRHLHGFIRDVEPTEEEWMAAIRFLTATGKKCDDQRQEFILLSDTLGATMLIDAINHRKPGGATESSVLGPFYQEGAPAYGNGADLADETTGGDPVLVSGKVVDLDGAPIPGAVLDIWQTAPDAVYAAQDPAGSFNLCGRITTGDDGRYSFRTRKPVSYTIPGDGPGRRHAGCRRPPQLAPRPYPFHALGSRLRDAGDPALHRRRSLPRHRCRVRRQGLARGSLRAGRGRAPPRPRFRHDGGVTEQSVPPSRFRAAHLAISVSIGFGQPVFVKGRRLDGVTRASTCRYVASAGGIPAASSISLIEKRLISLLPLPFRQWLDMPSQPAQDKQPRVVPSRGDQ